MFNQMPKKKKKRALSKDSGQPPLSEQQELEASAPEEAGKVKPKLQAKTDYKYSRSFKEHATNSESSSSKILEQSEEQEKNPSPKSSSRKKKKNKKPKENKGYLLSQVLLSEHNDSDKGKYVSSIEDDNTEENKTFSRDKEEEPSDLQTFTKDNFLLSTLEKERNNFLQVVILIYDVGLQALRKLFMDIHPTWSNRPTDAKSLEKGVMKLKGHESTVFDDGNIDKWDVSLITTVLLYSKKCKDEISKRSEFESAIRSIKDHKNQMISHNTTERISDVDFKKIWPSISKSIKTIGGKTEDIEGMSKGDILEVGKFYRDLFLEEIANRSAIHTKISEIDRKMDILVAERNPDASKPETTPSLKDLSGPKWDEWLRFCDRVRNFDYHQYNYILITDAMSRENLKHFSPLRSVPWKVVLDFDPCSEEKGMYHDFIAKQGNNRLIHMLTPDEIRRQNTASLARHLDTHKTQWMFVNGREKDGIGFDRTPQTFQNWKSSSVKQITKFFICCSDPDKFDKHKPIICFVLPFRKETVPFVTMSVERLMENFDEFNINFVGTQQDQCNILSNVNIQITELSPGLLSMGMSELFHMSPLSGYCVPTCQAKMPVRLKQQEYLYLKEYLTVLYEGCEDLPKVTGDTEEENKLQKMLNEHRESFMSGNWISLTSLFSSHDARREIGKEIQNYVQRILDQGPTHSTIVEIRHAPGTGGSTIARRVMWELHKFYPCAFARLEDHNYDLDEEVPFINELADRISALQDLCQTTALILLDGNHTRIEALSNRLVRALNIKGQRAVLIRCQHGSSKYDPIPEASDVHRSFFVNVKLEDSREDLMEFEAKYKDCIEQFSSKKAGKDLCRVFHFPLLAMLQHFRPKLKQIVYETFDDMEPLEKEIAVVVAFIQKYAAQATPAPLLYQAFKQYVQKSSTSKGITYKDINKLITEQLLNLMVLYIFPKRHSQGFKSRIDYFPESYTFQHPLVAELVLDKVNLDQKRCTSAVARHFLSLPIFDDERFYPLINDLFTRKRNWGGKSRFARLFEDLIEESYDIAGDIFIEAAEKTDDATLFASAARFYAKKRPPSFLKAKQMIIRSFDTRNAKSKNRIVYNAKGLVLLLELYDLTNACNIKSLSHLETLAEQALDAFKKARNFPPTFPNPLIGEVKVWLACIDWIAKSECNGDSDKTLEFITTKAPPFFRTCIGDSFHLLDVVDNIVQSVPTLLDPEETQRQANKARLSLMKTFNKERKVSFTRRGKEDVIKACKAICSAENFPRSSQNELNRLQAQYILSRVDDQPLEMMNPTVLEYLVKLLEDLVLTEKQGSMAYHLMRICVLIRGPKHYTLEKGLSVTEKWISENNHDPLPYFYQMAICFLKIWEGYSLEYTSRYHKSIKKCREMSQSHCRNTMSTHFLSKTGEGMNRLISKAALFHGETEYPKNLERMKDFWTIGSRKKLLECRGRIRLRSQSGRRSRKQTYIELIQGNIELYVGKNADIGQVERDFNPGSMVYFVVSFNLQGPVANGITFKPTSSNTN